MYTYACILKLNTCYYLFYVYTSWKGVNSKIYKVSQCNMLYYTGIIPRYYINTLYITCSTARFKNTLLPCNLLTRIKY